MKQTRLVKLAGAVAALALSAAVLMGADEKTAAPKGPTAGETYKNIKVLKDLPADQLLPTMNTFGQSLGVSCDFCHVGGDFAKDDKKTKITARAMIVMASSLNKNEPVVDKKVTCFMCHHGRPSPTRSADEEKAKSNAKPAGDAGEVNR